VVSTDPILSPNGAPYTSGDGFRYHFLDTPIVLDAETYEIQAAELGTGYAYSWLGNVNIPGLTGPLVPEFNENISNLANYGTTPAGNLSPGLAGPNFLVATPEPTALGACALAGLALLRRR
jgi:hypothetical protein